MLQQPEFSWGFERYGRLIFALQRSSLSRNAKAVMCALCGLVDWSTWQRQFPTWWLARRAGVSEDTVLRALPELLALKLLVREELPSASPLWQVLPEPILLLEPVSLAQREGTARPPARKKTHNTGSSGTDGGGHTPHPGAEARGASGAGQGAAAGTQGAGRTGQETLFRAHGAVQRPEWTAPSPQVSANPRFWPEGLATQAAAAGPQTPREPSQPAAPFLQDLIPTASQKQASLQRVGMPASKQAAATENTQRVTQHPPKPLPDSAATAARANVAEANNAPKQPKGPTALSPEVVADLPSDIQRFRAILTRWSGPEAPTGCAWQIRLDEDTDWYRREIAAVAQKEGLDPLAILNGWDEFLELITRGRRDCRFPLNFKNSLRNQVGMWQRIRQSQASQAASSRASLAPAARASYPPTHGKNTAFERRESTRPRYITREQWHTDQNGNPRTMSYREYEASARSCGMEVWPRERFDTHVRQNGLEPVA